MAHLNDSEKARHQELKTKDSRNEAEEKEFKDLQTKVDKQVG